MQRLTLALPGNEALAHQLAQACGSDVGSIETRRFPDGESYVRLHGDPAGRAAEGADHRIEAVAPSPAFELDLERRALGQPESVSDGFGQGDFMMGKA